MSEPSHYIVTMQARPRVAAPRELKTWLVASVLLALVLGLASNIQAQDGRAQISEFLAKCMKADPATVLDGSAVRFSFELKVTSGLSSQEVEARWKEVSPHPDHPERIALERHRRLQRQSEITSGQVTYFDGRAWSLSEDRSGGKSRMHLSAGGRSDTRWMHTHQGAGSQLVAIRAGTPFPAGYNANRYLDSTRDYVGLLVCFGLNRMPPGAGIQDIQIKENRWTANVTAPPGLTMTIDGAWHDSAFPVVRAIMLASSSAPGSQSEFSNVSVVQGLPPMALEVIRRRDDAIIETFKFTSFEQVSRAEAETTGALPEADASARFHDFRTSSTSDAEQFADMKRVTWKQDGAIDSYLLTNPDGTPLQSAEPAQADAPTARPAWSTERRVATVLSIVAGVVLVIFLVRRKLR